MPNPASKAAISACLVGAFGLTACTQNVLSPPTVELGATRQAERDEILAQNDFGQQFRLAQVFGGPWQLSVTTPTWSASFGPGECAEVDQAVAAFHTMPMLRPGPPAFQPGPSADTQVPPSVKDGARWQLGMRAYAEDWSAMDITLTGTQGPYAIRANNLMYEAHVCHAGR